MDFPSATMNRLAWLCFSLFLFSCSGKQELSGNFIARNDFEMLDGWGTCTSPSLTKERAHSGKYAVKVDAQNEFGLGFDKPLWELMPKKPAKIKLAAWVYLPSPDGKAVLAFMVNDSNNTLMAGTELKLEEKVRSYRKWVKLTKTITVPAHVQQNHRLRLFLWRAGATVPVYLDDVEMEVSAYH